MKTRKIGGYEFGDYMAAIRLEKKDGSVEYVTKFADVDDFVSQYGKYMLEKGFYLGAYDDRDYQYKFVIPIIGLNDVFGILHLNESEVKVG